MAEKIALKIEKGKESIKTKIEHAKDILATSGVHVPHHHIHTSTNEKTWTNWGENITVEPESIFRPSSLKDLKDIVKKANKENKHIRCVAEGHSWSSLSVTNDYLVITAKLDKVEVSQSDKWGWTVTAEAGAPISKIDHVLRSHNPPLALDSMTLLTPVRAAGIVSTISHGAKFTSRTIPNEVVSLQILTADGELHVFDDETDPLEMSAARGSLGLLGIIYQVTWRVQPMFNLRMIDFFPPVLSWLHPATLKEFVETSDSVEIFYWPFNSGELSVNDDKLWVKQWLRTEDDVTESQLEVHGKRFWQDLRTKFGESLYEFILKHPYSTPHITNLLFKSGIEGDANVVLQAPDAIHYDAGTENIKLESMEFAVKADKDFKNVAEEFNHIITKIYDYAKQGKFPINVTAEMRILKSSNILLAPGYDEDPDAVYFFIEVLTLNDTKYWDEFTSELAQRWIDKYQALPHWGKKWEYLPNIKSHVRKQLGDRIQKFEQVRAKYDPNKVFFDNESLTEIFYGKSA